MVCNLGTWNCFYDFFICDTGWSRYSWSSYLAGITLHLPSVAMAYRHCMVTRSQSHDSDFVYRGQQNYGNIPRVVPEEDRCPRRLNRGGRGISPCRFPEVDRLGEVSVPMTVEEAARYYEAYYEASRLIIESTWAYKVFVKVAAERLNLGLERSKPFSIIPTMMW